jgi:hypothetical protein
MEEGTSTSFDSFELQLNNEAKDFLRGAANWSMGLAILGFIGSGFLLLAALAMFAAGSMAETNRALQGMPTSSMAVMYLLMAILYFIPMLYLMKFSSSTKRALDENNIPKLATSFGNLKNHFMSAVLSVIGGIILFIAFAVIVAASTAGRL